MATLRELASEKGTDLYDDVQLPHAYLDNLARHMYEISDDPSGSDPSLYFNNEEDQKTLKQFLRMATELDWPDAEPIIDMRASRKGIPAWTGSLRTAKAGLTKALFFPKIKDTQRGYLFGRLNVKPTQQVAICEDGRLRSLRSGAALIESKGIGWGRLPDREYLLPAIHPVEVLIDYAPLRSLGEALLSRIEPEHLSGIEA